MEFRENLPKATYCGDLEPQPHTRVLQGNTRLFKEDIQHPVFVLIQFIRKPQKHFNYQTGDLRPVLHNAT